MINFAVNKHCQNEMIEVKTDIFLGDWAKGRLKNLSETDKMRNNAKNDSVFGKNMSNWVGKETVYPTNVLHFATECQNKNHPAAFPENFYQYSNNQSIWN